MREIKFRAWDIEEKKMLKQTENLTFNESGNERDAGWMFCAHELGKIVVMQFTGLKDKNGKEIYEGDIVRSNDGERDYVDVVSFSYIHGVAFGKERYADLGLPHGFTCIGNIYENPDLLK